MTCNSPPPVSSSPRGHWLTPAGSRWVCHSLGVQLWSDDIFALIWKETHLQPITHQVIMTCNSLPPVSSSPPGQWLTPMGSRWVCHSLSSPVKWWYISVCPLISVIHLEYIYEAVIYVLLCEGGLTLNPSLIMWLWQVTAFLLFPLNLV